MNPTLPLLTLLGLAPFALAQDPTPAPSGLEKARSLFDKVDLDDDGLITAVEAGRSRIPGAQFVAHDDDRDRKLTREEFTLFYRDLLVSAGRTVPQDLAAEVKRVEGARRTRKAEEERRRTPRPTDEPKGTEGGERSGGADPKTEAERVAAARQKAEDERIQKARADADAQREQRAREARQDAEAQRIAAAREQAKAQETPQGPTEAERVAAARAKAEAERITKAREPKPVAGEGGPAAARRERPGQAATPESRAAGYVKRLVDAGRLTPAQARDYYSFLTAPQAGRPVAEDQATELRAAQTRAKNRISDLVVAGHLSAEEGRQLASAVDDRARAMLPKPAPERTEPVRRAGTGETPVRGPAPERGGTTPPVRGDGARGDKETPPAPGRGRRAGDDGKGAGDDAGDDAGEAGDAKRRPGKKDNGNGDARRGTGGSSARRRDG